MDEYYRAFEDLFKETVSRTGIEIPYELEVYAIQLMAHYINRTDIDSDETFAEQYLKAVTQIECKTVGDRALMVYGWFPVRRRHKGIETSYYEYIGKASYSRCNAQVFELLAKHFDIVGEVMRYIPTQDVHSLVNLN